MARSNRSLVGFLAALVLLCTGCAAGSISPEPDENVLIAASQSEIPSLDPHTVNGTVGLRVTDAVYDTLVREDLASVTKEATVIEPHLAESWTVSADGTRYRFTIRENVLFHDGTPLTAVAVHKNFERLLNKDAAYYSTRAAANMTFLTRWIESTEVIQSGEFEITLKKPFAELPRLLKDRRMGIISPSAFEEHDDSYLATHPVGTGPFATEQFSPGRPIELHANTDYWNGGPELDRLVFVTIQDSGSMATALQTRKVDLILSAGAQQIAQLAGDDGVEFQFPEAANQYFIRLNTRSGPTANAAVRQALNYAIDRRAIEAATDGQSRPLYGVLPVGNSLWQDEDAPAYRYDPEHAEELLAQAGYGDGFDMKIFAPSAGPGFSQSKALMALVQQDLAAIGVDLTVEYMDFTTLVAKESPGYADDIAGSYNGWTTGADSAYWLETMFSPTLIPPAGSNRGWYVNEQIGIAFDEARGTVDDENRQSLYREAVRRIDVDAPWIFLYQDRLPRLFRSEVQGIAENPSAFIDYARLSKSGNQL